MESIPVSRLRTELQRVLRRVMAGERIVVTSRGQPAAWLVPPEDPQQKARELLDELAATAQIGDIESPVDGPWDSAR